MRRISCLFVLLAVLLGLSARRDAAQLGSTSKAVQQITGVVQSFRGDTLDVKPAASPAVWVMIPADLKVDRSALKPGAEVTVEAHWADLCYIATQITVRK